MIVATFFSAVVFVHYDITLIGMAKQNFLLRFFSLNDLIAYIENEIDLTTILISQLNTANSSLFPSIYVMGSNHLNGISK